MTGPHQSFRQHSSQEARAPPRLPRVVCVFTIQLGPQCLVHPGQLITVVGIRGPRRPLADRPLLTTVSGWVFGQIMETPPLCDAVADDTTEPRASRSLF